MHWKWWNRSKVMSSCRCQEIKRSSSAKRWIPALVWLQGRPSKCAEFKKFYLFNAHWLLKEYPEKQTWEFSWEAKPTCMLEESQSFQHSLKWGVIYDIWLIQSAYAPAKNQIKETSSLLNWQKMTKKVSSNTCTCLVVLGVSGMSRRKKYDLLHTLVINGYFEALHFRNASVRSGPCSPFCLRVLAIPDSGVSGEVALEPSSTTWICTMWQMSLIRTL